MIINPKNYKSILCLNGKLPDKKFFSDFEKLPIIAADGAANYLNSIDIIPDMIIGDLDSVAKNLLFEKKFIMDKNQNFSDFQKSIKYLESQNLLPAIILGISGGYIDHILNNINIFLDTKSIFYDDNIIGMVISEGSHQFDDLKLGTKLSIFGIPNCLISTTGLKWNLQNDELTFPGFNSCFNRSIEKKISIDIKKGRSLLLIYISDIIDAGVNSHNLMG